MDDKKKENDFRAAANRAPTHENCFLLITMITIMALLKSEDKRITALSLNARAIAKVVTNNLISTI